MTYNSICHMQKLNDTDIKKVYSLALSIYRHGITDKLLYCDNGLITGSHRLDALRVLDRIADKTSNNTILLRITDILSSDVADDITDMLINHNVDYGTIPFDDNNESDILDWISG